MGRANVNKVVAIIFFAQISFLVSGCTSSICFAKPGANEEMQTASKLSAKKVKVHLKCGVLLFRSS